MGSAKWDCRLGVGSAAPVSFSSDQQLHGVCFPHGRWQIGKKRRGDTSCFLTPQLGTGTLTVLLAQESHLANPAPMGRGRSLPTMGCTANAHGKGHKCMTSNSGREESHGNSNPTCHSILTATGTHARVSRRAVNTVIRQQNLMLIGSPQRQHPEGLNTPSTLLGHTQSPDPKAQLPFPRVSL